mmetsp:Transcript_65077/g.105496  ORF Transcript_65077/g.105496 Transcript_65077/m.105496 type:complete len:255 (+) Transcript_65077:3139-3903(+)
MFSHFRERCALITAIPLAAPLDNIIISLIFSCQRDNSRIIQIIRHRWALFTANLNTQDLVLQPFYQFFCLCKFCYCVCVSCPESVTLPLQLCYSCGRYQQCSVQLCAALLHGFMQFVHLSNGRMMFLRLQRLLAQRARLFMVRHGIKRTLETAIPLTAPLSLSVEQITTFFRRQGVQSFSLLSLLLDSLRTRKHILDFCVQYAIQDQSKELRSFLFTCGQFALGTCASPHATLDLHLVLAQKSLIRIYGRYLFI